MEETTTVTTDGEAPADIREAFQTLRETIMAADDTRWEDVEVKEWGVTLRIFSMSGDARAHFLVPFAADDPKKETDEQMEARLRRMTPALLIQTAFAPETGTNPQAQYQVFGDDDIAWLGTKNSAALERVGAIALRLSGLDRDARERAGKD